MLDSNLVSGSTISIYRQSSYINNSLIGRGTAELSTSTVYTGTGYLVRWHVENGQQVSKGDLLYESMEGSFDLTAENLDQIIAPQSGVIATVSTGKGKVASADEELFIFYPDSGLRIQASVMESELQQVNVGDKVQIILPTHTGSDQPLTGTVEKISLTAEEATETTCEASYAVYIITDAVDALRYGMNVTVLFN